ncbi:class I SAM-dependent methyltransferase [Paenibacillus marinisediminis]
MEQVIRYYSTFDEWGRLDREPLEFMVNWHHIKKHLPTVGKVLDNGAGPGKYSMELAKLGYQVTLTDLTPRLVDHALDKANEIGLINQFDGFYALDARDLQELPSEQFDASLMLGPMYHLQTEVDQIAAVRELYRVTKMNGVVYVAFISRIRKLQNALMFPKMWKPLDRMDAITSFMDNGCFNHEDEGRFTGAYYYHIDDIKPFMESCGFETLDLIGSSSIAGRMSEDNWNYWREQGEEAFQQLMELIYESSSDPHLLGVSSHLLYIGRKK